MNLSTLCTSLVSFGPEISEFTTLTIAPFVAIRQKSAYHAKYLRISWTYLDLLCRFRRRISGYNIFILFIYSFGSHSRDVAMAKPVKFGRCLQTSRGMTCTLCFGIRQRIGRSKSAFKRYNCNNWATLCPNLVNFCSTISEFSLLKCAIFAAIRPQLYLIGRSQFWFQESNRHSFLYIL